MADTHRKLMIARRLVVALLAVVVGWPICAAAADSGGMGVVARAALFVAGCVVLGLGLRRHVGVALLLAAVAALGAEPDPLERFTVWTAVFALAGTLGAGLLLGRRSKHSLVLMSLPWWGLGDAAGWTIYVAFAFSMAWLISLCWPLLSGRGPKVDRVVDPDPRLARGPLVEVTPRDFGYDRGRTVMRLLAVIMTVGCGVGAVVWVTVGEPAGPAITYLSASFAVAFWASELSSRAMRFRVDEKGVHATFFVRRTSIRWSEIGELVSVPQKIGTRFGVITWMYYCVLGGHRQIAFPERMLCADELAGIIAAATGMNWQVASDADDLPGGASAVSH